MNSNLIKAITTCAVKDQKFAKAFAGRGEFGFIEFIMGCLVLMKREAQDEFNTALNAIAEAKANGTKPNEETLTKWFAIIRSGFEASVIPAFPKRFAGLMAKETFAVLYNLADLPVIRDNAKHGQHGLKPKAMNHRIATEQVDAHNVKLTAYYNNQVVSSLVVNNADFRNGFGKRTVSDFYGNSYEMKSDQHRVLELVNQLGCDELRKYYSDEFIGYFVNRGTKRPDGTSFTGGAIRNLAGKVRPNSGK